MAAFNCSWRSRKETAVREPSFVWKSELQSAKKLGPFIHCLNQRLSVWQGENAADVPWILGQWILATYSQRQSHNEPSGMEERTAGQEVGHCSQDCRGGLSMRTASFSVGGAPSLWRPMPGVCWERMWRSTMNATTLHCWWRLPNLCSLFLKVPQWSWPPVFHITTLLSLFLLWLANKRGVQVRGRVLPQDRFKALFRGVCKARWRLCSWLSFF